MMTKQTKESLQSLIDDCQFKDWNILLRYDGDRPYIQIMYKDKDCYTGIEEEQWCRKFTLSYHMCDTEVVDTVYLAVKRAMEHEVRENFKFRGRIIYNPHRSVYSLWNISTSEHIDVRDNI